MKRTIFAFTVVLAVALLATSCGGGGNISTVKNGVFSNYDPSITVGKALENNPNLKGGKWAATEMNGRNYVTYTVNMTQDQIISCLLNDPQGLPNYFFARNFFTRLDNISDNAMVDGSKPKFASLTTDEFKEVHEILKNNVGYGIQKPNEDIKPLVTVDHFVLIISFLINQDDTFVPNMFEGEISMTLNCFDNYQLSFKSGNTDNDQVFLRNIYKGYSVPLQGSLW
jgi:hypothetical protein